MNVHQIQYVFAIARCSSFTKAAHDLHISQPALSANIQKLEEELGTPLFDRSSFPVKLTYAGEIFVEKASQILELSDNLEKEIRDITVNKKGRLRIGIGQGMMPYILPLVINEFHTAFPNIKIIGSVLTETEMTGELLNNTIDFGIHSEYDGLSLPLHSDLSFEDIGHEELLLAAHEKFISDQSLIDGLTDTANIQALRNIPLVMPPENTFLRKVYDQIFEQNSIVPNIAATVDDSISLYRLAGTGLAAGIVPKITTKWVQTNDKISVYSLSTNTTYLKLKVIYNKRAHIGEPEKHLIALLRRIIARTY